MKNSFLLVVSLLISYSIHAQKSNDTGQAELQPVFDMSFEQKHFDLGKIKKGDIKTFNYNFVNKGQEDIVIEIVSACECTTLDWTRGAIKPGESGTIEARFDSTAKEKSETVEIDINLQNREAETGYKRLEIVSFSFELLP